MTWKITIRLVPEYLSLNFEKLSPFFGKLNSFSGCPIVRLKSQQNQSDLSKAPNHMAKACPAVSSHFMLQNHAVTAK